jgi:hypothetical protein
MNYEKTVNSFFLRIIARGLSYSCKFSSSVMLTSRSKKNAPASVRTAEKERLARKASALTRLFPIPLDYRKTLPVIRARAGA